MINPYAFTCHSPVSCDLSTPNWLLSHMIFSLHVLTDLRWLQCLLLVRLHLLWRSKCCCESTAVGLFKGLAEGELDDRPGKRRKTHHMGDKTKEHIYLKCLRGMTHCHLPTHGSTTIVWLKMNRFVQKKHRIKGPHNPTCQLLPTSSKRKVKMAWGKQEREKRRWRIGVE